MVKRISRDASDVEFWVRFLVEAPNDVIGCATKRVWFNGRTSGCQSDDGSSILPTRTKITKEIYIFPDYIFVAGRENRKTEPGTRQRRVGESGEEVLNKIEPVGRIFYLET